MHTTITVNNVSSFKIEPCILVRERITVDRGVTYQRRDISEEVLEDGSEQATWQTDRHFKNRSETKAAEAVYNRARNRIRAACLVTDIGFICPSSKRADLDVAIAEAKAFVDDFNNTAKVCKVNLLVVCTRIESDNLDGVSLIQNTIVQATETIKSALTNFDPKTVKESLSASKQMASVLSDPSMKSELMKAREEASELCKEIQKLVKEFDGNVANAMASEKGAKIKIRTDATWNF